MHFATSQAGATISPMGYTYYLDDGGDSRLKGKGKFWVLGGVVIPDAQWLTLRNAVDAVLQKWGVSVEQELKWSHGGIRIKQLMTQDPAQRPKQVTPLHHLTQVPQVRQVYIDLLRILPTIHGARVMFVWCVKDDALTVCTGTEPDKRCYRDMFHDALERFEYFLTTGQLAYGHVVIDKKSNKFDETIRFASAELLRKGTSYVNINHIIDGVNVADSAVNFGLRMADYVVGAVHRHLESGYSGYYSNIEPIVHRDGWGHLDGVGAKRFPSQAKSASSLTKFPPLPPTAIGF